jgi:hypothetical protein
MSVKIKLSKKDSLKLYNKIIHLIKKSNLDFFKLKKLKGVMGYCEWDDGIIIDYRKEFIPTLIHECIHFLEPTWSETQVLYAEKRVVNSITPNQVIKLLKNFIGCFL